MTPSFISAKIGSLAVAPSLISEKIGSLAVAPSLISEEIDSLSVAEVSTTLLDIAYILLDEIVI